MQKKNTKKLREKIIYISILSSKTTLRKKKVYREFKKKKIVFSLRTKSYKKNKIKKR